MKKVFKRALATFLTVIMLFSVDTLRSVSFVAKAIDMIIEESYFDYYTVDDGVFISGYADNAPKDMIIPDEIDGIPVIGIDAEQFFGKNLFSITIPSSIRTINNPFFLKFCGYFKYDDKLIFDLLLCLGYDESEIEMLLKDEDAIEYFRTDVETLFEELNGPNMGEAISAAISDPSSPSAIFFLNSFETVKVIVDDENAFYCCDECGVIYNKEKTVCYTSTSNLYEYSVQDGVQVICDGAFSYDHKLNSIKIPDSVTSIGYYAFGNCTSLTSLTIPDSVIDIGVDAFYNVQNVVYNGTATGAQWGAKNYNKYADGYLLFNDSEKTELIYCNPIIKGELAIPNSVKSICDKAFYDCTGLTSVTIPDSVTSIGDRAFYYCTGLTSVIIPDSVTSIGDYMFTYCNSLLSMTLPDGITNIGDYTFYNCSGLASITIPDGITSIDYASFYGCESLTSIIIPDGVTSIGDYAFEYCYSLANITIPDSVTSIGRSAFNGCNSLTSIILPDGLTNISDNTFYNCSSLASITIPDSITSIDYASFYGCESLTNIVIPDGVTSIGDYAFEYCYSLANITIPQSVTSIGWNAFYSCDNLTINCYKNSYAEQYAIDNDIPYRYIGETDSQIERIVIDDIVRMQREDVLWINENGKAIYDDSPEWITIYYKDGSVESGGIYAYSERLNSDFGELISYIDDTHECDIDYFGTYQVNMVFAGINCCYNVEILESNIQSVVVDDVYLKEGIDGCIFTESIWDDDSEEYRDAEYFNYFTNPENITINYKDGTSISGTPSYIYKKTGYNILDTFMRDIVESDQSYENQWGVGTHSVTIDFLGEKCKFNIIIAPASEKEKYQKVEISGMDELKIVLTKFNGQKETFDIVFGESFACGPDSCFCKMETSTGKVFECEVHSDENSENQYIEIYGLTSNTISSNNPICDIVCKGEYLIGNIVNFDANGGTVTPECIMSPISFMGDNGYIYLPTPVKTGYTCLGWSTESNATSAGFLCGEEYEVTSDVTLYAVWEKDDAETHDVHSFYHVVIPATCTANGVEYDICTECGEVFNNVIIPAGHKFTHIVEDATCAADGFEYDICSVCGEMFNYTAIPKISEHNWSDWIVVQEPTCTEKGTKTRYCTNPECTANENGEIPALGHDYLSVITEPTCTEKGYTTHICQHTGCNNSFVDSYVDALGHDYASTVIGATCTEQGYTFHECSRCKDSFKDTYIETIPHIYGDWIIDDNGNCESEGKKHRTCSACGNTEYQNVAPQGHRFGDWDVVKDATVLFEGIKQRKCVKCGTIETVSINKISIDINKNQNYGLAEFTVVNSQTKQPIKDASIFIKTENDGETTIYTDSNGNASVVLPVGKIPISVYADGYLTRNIKINIKAGINTIPLIGLSNKPTYDAKVTSHEMTLQEMKDAGIDTSTSANRHVFKYNLQIKFGSQIDYTSLVYYMNDLGEIMISNYPNSTSNSKVTVTSNKKGFIIANKSDASGSGNSDGHNSLSKMTIVYPVSEYAFLILDGDVRWTKEIFDVEMLIVNNSMTDTLDDLTATLNLPDGLSLAEMADEQQTVLQHIEHIAEGESSSFHWYVRGDEEGSYSLNATLDGLVMPFEEEIHDRFICENGIQVWAGSALHLDFEFPDTAYYGQDYDVRITLTNVSNKTLYNVFHTINGINQGHLVHYSDGDIKDEAFIENGNMGSQFAKEFKPGDKLVIEMSINILFESELMEHKLKQLENTVTDIETFVKGYKCVTFALNLLDSIGSKVVKLSKGLDDVISAGSITDETKAKLVKTLYKNLDSMYSKYVKTGNKTLDSAIKLTESGIGTTLDIMANDPQTFIEKCSKKDLMDLLEKVSALENEITNVSDEDIEKFDIYDSLRFAISSLPICFTVTDFVLTEDEMNTTSIPYSFSTYNSDAQYFGVSDVSSYFMNLAKAVMAEVYHETVPGTFKTVSGLDDPFNYAQVKREIIATENEVKAFKAQDATGEVKFKAWVENNFIENSFSNSSDIQFELFCDDNKSASYEDGILTFTGMGTVSVKPKGLGGGTLYIQDSEGNTFEYAIDVVPQHTCSAGEKKFLIPPTTEYNGYAVYCCKTCGEVIEVEELTVCSNHSFGNWHVDLESSEDELGIVCRECEHCGYTETRFVESTEHIHNYTVKNTVDATCLKDGSKTYVCLCGDSYSERIPAMGHSWSEWTVEVNPTATTEGIKSRICSKCKQTESASIPCMDDGVTEMKLNSNKAFMNLGETVVLSAEFNSESKGSRAVKWMSTNPEIVCVDNGMVSAVDYGSAMIVAETEDGEYKDYCIVNVIGVASTNESTTVDHENKFIYGLSTGLTNITGYAEKVSENLDLEYSTETIGTGTVINILRNGSVVDSYITIIFGDVNGDGWYDGMDSVIVNCLANGLFSREQVGEAVYMAADCNHDGVIDENDVALLEQAGLLLASIDQTKSGSSLTEDSMFVEYLSLISQKTATTETPIEEAQADPTPADEPVVNKTIIQKIIDFIIYIFKMITSYIPKVF